MVDSFLTKCKADFSVTAIISNQACLLNEFFLCWNVEKMSSDSIYFQER